MKRFASALLTILLSLFTVSCNSLSESSELPTDTISLSQESIRESEKTTNFTVEDNETGEMIIALYVKKPLEYSFLEQCAEDLLVSQRKVKNGEVSISYPDNITPQSDPNKPQPISIMFYEANDDDPAASVTVYRQTEPDVMDEVLGKICRELY